MTPEDVDEMLAAINTLGAQQEQIVATTNQGFADLQEQIRALAAALIAEQDQQKAFGNSVIKALGMVLSTKAPAMAGKRIHRDKDGLIAFVEEIPG